MSDKQKPGKQRDSQLDLTKNDHLAAPVQYQSANQESSQPAAATRNRIHLVTNMQSNEESLSQFEGACGGDFEEDPHQLRCHMCGHKIDSMTVNNSSDMATGSPSSSPRAKRRSPQQTGSWYTTDDKDEDEDEDIDFGEQLLNTLNITTLNLLTKQVKKKMKKPKPKR